MSGGEMNRTIWLAAFCLAGLGGLCASQVTASISRPDEGNTNPSIMTAGIGSDILAVADKVDLTGFRPAAEVTLAEPAAPVLISPVKTKGVALHHNAKAKVIAALPKPRPKSRISRNDKPPRLAGDPRKCPETNGLVALITSLTGTSHCSL
jgi:hypothetical protein